MSPMRSTLIGMMGLAALAACDVAPTGEGSTGVITGEMRADYLDAVASVGCVLRDERQYGAVDFQAGLSREQTLAITANYLSRGKAERVGDGNSIRINTGPCAA
ncbi:hypothetical protein KBY22_08415 [Ruegeria pomeroyi]|uniref:hypothetical protein n=1 Tax=Ruegeria pomeroyi TaxID=89184 RepID=UPI001F270BB8|nr:hypothetical protein [Ruegeria pomeroyi]MCE8507523.1 hypothetical protein [Ruegeria pomeroyi]MCE8512711.1 hypothetical protein [Ruegeria pomeroyi]MCE8531323.1 hypothetical protein [Ruegeria pomeroyi]